ncbi:MAG: aminoacyl-tRNA hydrolase [Alphaproteobacteria bacterium]|jgi:ribosome-associated protein|nr:MAG: aminoacyl-tRNA hydrolase [Alphaproteobacteria bacterium]
MIAVTPRIAIDEDAIEEVFVRAGGPGGQNVNKVATAVQLRFDAAGSPSLDAPMQARLRRLAGRRMTADGAVVILARRFRTQERNRADAYERLIDLIRRAAEPGKRRVPTRPTAASRERRREAKLARGRTKRLRHPVDQQRE